MNDMTIRMEVVEPLEDHLHHWLNDLGRDDSAYPSSTKEPKRLAQWFKHEAGVLPAYAINRKGVVKLSDIAPADTFGIALGYVIYQRKLGIGVSVGSQISDCIDFDSHVAFFYPPKSAMSVSIRDA